MIAEMPAPVVDVQAPGVQVGAGVAPSDNGKMKSGMTRSTLPKSIIPKFDAYRSFFPPSVTDGEVCDHLYHSDCQKSDCRKASIREILNSHKSNTTISGSVQLDKYVVACLVNKNQPDLGSSNKDLNTGTLANARSVTGCPKMVIRQKKARREYAKACISNLSANAVLSEHTDAEVAMMEDGDVKSGILTARKKALEDKKEAMKRKRDAEVDFLSAPEDLATKVSSLPNANRAHTERVYREFGLPLSKRQLRVPATDKDAFKTCVDHSFRKSTFSMQQERMCMHECLEIEDADNKLELQEQLRSAYDTILGIQSAFMARVMPTPPTFKVFSHTAICNSELNVPEPPPEPEPEPEPEMEVEPAPEMEVEMEPELNTAPDFGIRVISYDKVAGKRFPLPSFLYEDDDELEEGEIRDEPEQGEIS